ncbi:Glycosyltransferase [Methanosarcina barkeri str. Wiesmoor]|uniref:Glycosyltransferase n=2 Tax=Methanosarcina barkeri TaxID=2208 RepID=A0A0E3QHQ7_METBA|nr:glycosyltransferase family 4 protein [Methanosarcina barkeri]AKB50220.1 Glycosyltransferase [Methanosarcina barkeri str. Wiesmoor]
MKILQVTNFFKPSWEAGGIARVAYEISKNLVQQGHEVTVFTTDGFKSRLKTIKNKPVNVDGINTYYFRNLSNYLTKRNIVIPYYLPFIARIKIQDFDVIHIHEHRTLLAVIVHYYSKKYNIPYVLQAHGTLPNTIGKQNLKKIFDVLWGNKILKDASKLISVSNTEVDQYLQMNVPIEKMVIIPNGIDVDSLSSLPEKGSFRARYHINQKHAILYLGRLHKIKGVDFLLRSFVELVKDIDDSVLILAGPDDGYKDKAKEQIREFGLEKKVIFTGYMGPMDKISAYLDADILVYPSSFEIFGLVPFEAIMSGTPVIVTDDCGCSEFIKRASCGYLVKYGDVTDFKCKMRLMLENPEIGNKFVENGQKYITNNLTWPLICKKMETLYENCIYKV